MYNDQGKVKQKNDLHSEQPSSQLEELPEDGITSMFSDSILPSKSSGCPPKKCNVPHMSNDVVKGTLELNRNKNSHLKQTSTGFCCRKRKSSYDEDPVLMVSKQLATDGRTLDGEENTSVEEKGVDDTSDDPMTQRLNCNLHVEDDIELTTQEFSPFQCLICPTQVSFKNNFLLQSHMNKEHDIGIKTVAQHNESQVVNGVRQYTVMCYPPAAHSSQASTSQLEGKKSKCHNCGTEPVAKGEKSYFTRGNCRKSGVKTGKEDTTTTKKNDRECESSKLKKNSLPLRKRINANQSKCVNQKQSSPKVSDMHQRIRKRKNGQIVKELKSQSLIGLNVVNIKRERSSSSVLSLAMKYEPRLSSVLEAKDYVEKIQCRCKNCGFGCISQYTLQDHEKYCSLIKPCSIVLEKLSPAQVKNNSVISKRIKTEVGADELSSSSSAFHVTGDVGGLSVTPQTYNCRQCKEVFNTLHSYEFHIEGKHGDKLTFQDYQSIKAAPYCKYCNTRFLTRTALFMHDCGRNNINLEGDVSQTSQQPHVQRFLPGDASHTSVGVSDTATPVPNLFSPYPFIVSPSGFAVTNIHSAPDNSSHLSNSLNSEGLQGERVSPRITGPDVSKLPSSDAHSPVISASPQVCKPVLNDSFTAIPVRGIPSVPNESYFSQRCQNSMHMQKSFLLNGYNSQSFLGQNWQHLCDSVNCFVADDYYRAPTFYKSPAQSYEKHSICATPAEVSSQYPSVLSYSSDGRVSELKQNVLHNQSDIYATKVPDSVVGMSSANYEVCTETKEANNDETSSVLTINSDNSCSEESLSVRISDPRSLDAVPTDSSKPDEESLDIELLTSNAFGSPHAYTVQSSDIDSYLICSKCYSTVSKNEFITHYAVEHNTHIDRLLIKSI